MKIFDERDITVNGEPVELGKVEVTTSLREGKVSWKQYAAGNRIVKVKTTCRPRILTFAGKPEEILKLAKELLEGKELDRFKERLPLNILGRTGMAVFSVRAEPIP